MAPQCPDDTRSFASSRMQIARLDSDGYESNLLSFGGESREDSCSYDSNQDENDSRNNDDDDDCAEEETERSRTVERFNNVGRFNKSKTFEDRVREDLDDNASFKQVKYEVRLQLLSAGVLLGSREDTSDGDQSPVESGKSQKICKNLFEIAGDFDAHLVEGALSEFALHCVTGRHRRVRRILQKHSVKRGQHLDDLVRLLETRETSMRYSPLLMVFVVLRKLAIYEKQEETGSESTQSSASLNYRVLEQNLTKVIKLLLLYGARPDAKDITGRTVLHYGADRFASPTTLKCTEMCIGAAYSAGSFGREVVLVNHKYHGRVGVVGGYRVDTCSRLVYVLGQRKEIEVLNRHLRLKEGHGVATPGKLNLCDVPDRCGNTALHEILDDGTRSDVAHFLLSLHNASVDVENITGDTVRSLAFRNAGPDFPVAQMLVDTLLKRAYVAFHAEQSCANCGTVGSQNCPLLVCQPCMSARYCSSECQKEHWHEGGHKHECPSLRKKYREAVVVKKPSSRNGDEADRTTVMYSFDDVSVTSFRRPSNVQVDETFTLKVQRMAGRESLLVFDKTKECEFCVGSEQKAYNILKSKVLENRVSAGTSIYLGASFDKKGNCLLYINQTKVKTW